MKFFSSLATAAQQRMEFLVPAASKAQERINIFRTVLLNTLREHKYALVAVKVSPILLLAGALLYINFMRVNTYYVLYVGRCKTPNFERIHQLAFDSYFEELNSQLDGVRLELHYRCNDGDPEKSERIYQEILHKEYLLVIDNTWGREFRKGAESIKAGIPVISINADKQDIDYGNNVVFIGHDDHVPGKVAYFAKKILKRDEVIFITEKDYHLTRGFEREFAAHGTKVISIRAATSKINNNDEKETLLRSLDEAIGQLRQSHKPPTVILNVHGGWGDVIIEHIDKNHDGISIVGGAYMVSKFDLTTFGLTNGNKAIIFTNPSDAITAKVYNDRKSFRAKDNISKYTNNDQLFIKRCLDAVSIIRETFYQGTTRKSDISREDFLEFFKGKMAGKNLAGKYDFYSFNDNLLLSDERTFEVYAQGESFSYQEQLKSQGQVTPNADIPVPNIYFGLELPSISNIDIEKKSFHAEFFYRLEYNKNYPEPKVHFRNAKSPNIQEIPTDGVAKGRNPQEIPTDGDRGAPTVYKLFRVSADFNMETDFSNFPFDTQELKIQAEVIKPSDRVNISFDYRSIEESKKQAHVNLDGWYEEDFFVTVDSFSSAIRSHTKIKKNEPQRVKSLNVRIQIRRDLKGPLITIFLPLFMIGIAALSLLYVEDNSFANIGAVGTGILLTTVTHSILFAQLTPRSNALTTADLLFYSTFVIVLLVFLRIILFNSGIKSAAIARVREWMTRNAIKVGTIALAGYTVITAVLLRHLLIDFLRKLL